MAMQPQSASHLLLQPSMLDMSVKILSSPAMVFFPLQPFLFAISRKHGGGCEGGGEGGGGSAGGRGGGSCGGARGGEGGRDGGQGLQSFTYATHDDDP